MLKQIAEGVLVHQSEFMQSNAIVVQGDSGVLLIDPGVTGNELACLARDLVELGQPVVVGVSTHPHWDHLLWHSSFGAPPRFGTARCAAAARAWVSDPNWKDILPRLIPPDIVDDVPLDLLGLVAGLGPDDVRIPWDGPQVRIVEHEAHAPGHAALVIEDLGVLVVGDMLSDLMLPLLNVNQAVDPIEDYLGGLRLIESVAGDIEVVVPGHGSVANSGQALARIEQDRAYVNALRDVEPTSDPRLTATPGENWLTSVHDRQVGQLARKREREGLPR